MSSDSQLPDDPRLNRIIEEYLRRQDAGQPTDLDSICRSYPDLADQLRAFLSDEDAVRAASGSGETDDRPTMDRETIAPQRQIPSGKLVGETIAGRYRLVQILGSGAMGCVYLAEDLTQKAKVAVKTPFFEGTHEKERKRRFRREAAALAAIRHPNICRVFEHGEHRGTPYLVMEFIEGPTLADLVSVQGIDPRQAALLCRGIAEGLGAAHAAGVVHRDLKPRNVLIETATRRVVVTDFGLARFTDDTETKLTHDGVVLGTPAYMPPEQVDGTWDQVGPRSDLYSLGIVLYELLTGKPPFTGRMYAVLGQVMHDKIPPVRKVRGDLDPEIDHICQTLTAKKPAERYPSARAVSAALMDYLANTDPAAKAEKRQATQLAAEREARRERVMVLCRKGKYAEAAAVLKEIGQWTGPGTDEYVRWARQEMEQLRSLPQKLRQDQSVLAETAQRLLSRHDYASVVQLLQDVPPDYRSEAVQKLLDKAIDRQDEVDLLQVAIQDAVERKQFGGLEKNLRRLLALKPGYTPAQKLLATLGEYQRRGIRDYHYSKSGELLPPEGLGLFSGLRLAALVGTLALLITYWLVKVYLAGSPRGELAVTVPEPPKPDLKPFVEAALTPLPDDGPPGQFHVFQGHTQPVHALRFSPDGKYLISTSGDSTLKVWDLATLTEKYSKRLEKGVGREWGVSDNGRLAIANWEATFVFDIETGAEVTRIPVPGLTAAITRDGTRVAITERTAPVTVWQIASDATVTKLCEFPRGPGEWTSLNFIDEGRHIVRSPSDEFISIIDASTGQEISSHRDFPADLRITNKSDLLGLSRDEKHYLRGDWDSKSIRELATGKLIHELPNAHGFAYLPGERYIVLKNYPTEIQLFDTIDGKVSPSLPAPEIKSDRKDSDYLTVSPDGRYLATGGGNVWDGKKFINTGDNAIYLWRIPKEYWPEAIPRSKAEDIRNDRLYVNQFAPSGGNGKSWASAMNDLQDALANARKPESRVREIWVAKGTYKPVDKGGSRATAFELVNGVAMYGGFEGVENSLEQRYRGKHESLLSGNIGEDGRHDDNSCHVIKCVSMNNETTLDGFTVSDGCANSPIVGASGGGMWAESSTATISQCVFRNNTSDDSGGAILFEGFSGKLIDCVFDQNRSKVGGAICTKGSRLPRSSSMTVIIRNSFTNNQADQRGGAIRSTVPLKLMSCQFRMNSVRGDGYDWIGGGAVHHNLSSFSAVNCFFSENHSIKDGGAIQLELVPGRAQLSHCTFVNNSTMTKLGSDVFCKNCNGGTFITHSICTSHGLPVSLNYDGNVNSGTDIVIHSCVRGGYDGIGNIQGDPILIGDTYKLDGRSPCIDAGNRVDVPDEFDLDADGDTTEPIPVDIEGNPRVRGKLDIGAFESPLTKNKE